MRKGLRKNVATLELEAFRAVHRFHGVLVGVHSDSSVAEVATEHQVQLALYLESVHIDDDPSGSLLSEMVVACGFVVAFPGHRITPYSEDCRQITSVTARGKDYAPFPFCPLNFVRREEVLHNSKEVVVGGPFLHSRPCVACDLFVHASFLNFHIGCYTVNVLHTTVVELHTLLEDSEVEAADFHSFHISFEASTCSLEVWCLISFDFSDLHNSF
jgi:hypothetical protein